MVCLPIATLSMAPEKRIQNNDFEKRLATLEEIMAQQIEILSTLEEFPQTLALILNHNSNIQESQNK